MTNKEIVASFFMEGYEKLNFDGLMEIVANDYLDHSPCHVKGNQECINALKNTAKLFGNMNVDILDMIEEDNKVAVRVRFECIHIGQVYGISATNRKISFESLETFRIEDGKIAESWGYWPDSKIIELLTK